MNQYEYEVRSKELLKDIPVEFHVGLRHLAYDHGHSAGWAEVLWYLDEFVDAIKQPCKDFENRIKNTK